MTATKDGKTFEPLHMHQQTYWRMQHLLRGHLMDIICDTYASGTSVDLPRAGSGCLSSR